MKLILILAASLALGAPHARATVCAQAVKQAAASFTRSFSPFGFKIPIFTEYKARQLTRRFELLVSAGVEHADAMSAAWSDSVDEYLKLHALKIPPTEIREALQHYDAKEYLALLAKGVSHNQLIAAGEQTDVRGYAYLVLKDFAHQESLEASKTGYPDEYWTIRKHGRTHAETMEAIRLVDVEEYTRLTRAHVDHTRAMAFSAGRDANAFGLASQQNVQPAEMDEALQSGQAEEYLVYRRLGFGHRETMQRLADDR